MKFNVSKYSANQNLERAMHVRDPLDFWIKQVKLLLCIKLMYLSFITSDPLEIHSVTQFMFYVHSLAL